MFLFLEMLRWFLVNADMLSKQNCLSSPINILIFSLESLLTSLHWPSDVYGLVFEWQKGVKVERGWAVIPHDAPE